MTPDSSAARSGALSRAYRVNLEMLAMVALLTGGFLVYSAQSLSVARRRPQFALLRVLGLERAALTRQIVLEGAAVGLAGAALGILLGQGLAALTLRVLGGDLGGGYFRQGSASLGFAPWAALASPGLGVAVAVASSLVPAREAAAAKPAVALKTSGEAGDPRRARARCRRCCCWRPAGWRRSGRLCGVCRCSAMRRWRCCLPAGWRRCRRWRGC